MIFDKSKIEYNRDINMDLFWDCDKSSFDIKRMKDFIISRVIHLGDINDYYSLFYNFGGIEGVKESIKNLPYIDKSDIGFICISFGLKKEELRCLKKTQWQKELLNCSKR